MEAIAPQKELGSMPSSIIANIVAFLTHIEIGRVRLLSHHMRGSCETYYKSLYIVLKQKIDGNYSTDYLESIHHTSYQRYAKLASR